MNDATTTIQAPEPTIPPANDIDWQAVKASYLQGTPLSIIAREHSLSVHQIRNKAWRNQWRNESLADATSQPSAYQDLVKEWQENMAITVLERSKWYANAQIEPINLKENRELEGALQSHIDAGRKLFGLDRQDNARPSAWAAGAAPGPVIDVTPVIQDKPVS